MLACKHRLNHAPHTLFAQLIRELIEVCLPPFNQSLFRLFDVVGQDRTSGVTDQFLHGEFRQRIDQPWLALRQIEDESQRFFGENLSGLRRVLQKQFFELHRGEVAQCE